MFLSSIGSDRLSVNGEVGGSYFGISSKMYRGFPFIYVSGIFSYAMKVCGTGFM